MWAEKKKAKKKASEKASKLRILQFWTNFQKKFPKNFVAAIYIFAVSAFKTKLIARTENGLLFFFWENAILVNMSVSWN